MITLDELDLIINALKQVEANGLHRIRDAGSFLSSIGSGDRDSLQEALSRVQDAKKEESKKTIKLLSKLYDVQDNANNKEAVKKLLKGIDE